MLQQQQKNIDKQFNLDFYLLQKQRKCKIIF